MPEGAASSPKPLAQRIPSSANPALVYLASLKLSGRAVMAGSLDIVSRKLGAKDQSGHSQVIRDFRHGYATGVMILNRTSSGAEGKSSCDPTVTYSMTTPAEKAGSL